jgi:outer membrane protein OmpA-like peptidoglycan-associated protein
MFMARFVLNRTFSAVVASAFLCVALLGTSRLNAQSQPSPQPAQGSQNGQNSGETAPPNISFDDLTADSDKPLYMRFGVFGAWSFTFHKLDFASTPECQTCLAQSYQLAPLQPNNFGSVWGSAIGGGLLTEIPITGRFGASLRVSYYAQSANSNLTAESLPATVPGVTFTAREVLQLAQNTVKFDGSPNNTSLPGSIYHRFNPQLGLLFIEPYLTYRVLDPLAIFVGARIGIPVVRRFNYAEVAGRVTNPQTLQESDQPFNYRDAVTGTATSFRNLRNGDLSLASVVVMPSVGFSYEFPLNATGTVLAAIEGFYSYGGLSKINGNGWSRIASSSERLPNGAPLIDSAGGSWFMEHDVRLSLGVKYSPFRTIRPELSPEFQETIRRAKQLETLFVQEREQNVKRMVRVDSINRVISAKVEELKKIGISVNLAKLVGVDADGREIPKPKLTIEQFRTQTVQPLLAQIYFDDNSAVLPSRYRRVRAAERASFKISDFAGKANIEVYRHILNIVGKRMTDNAPSVLFINGCNSGQGTEKDNLKLSEQRAVAISDYLQDVWKIPAKRLIIQKQNVPDKPASGGETGNAENRRVEMSSNVPEIFDPVRTDQVMRIADPPVLRFGLEINAGAGLKQWDMEINQFVENESVSLKTFSGGAKYEPTVDWKLNEEQSTMPVSNQDLSVQLTMTDVNNKNADAPIQSVPVTQIAVERKEVEGKPDKRIDTYDIIGFDFGTNTVTLDESAQKLLETIKKSLKPNSRITATGYTDTTGDAAKNKALATSRAEFIARALSGSARAVGVGPTTVNDNALPEGRAYNRYVRVVVETPTK